MTPRNRSVSQCLTIFDEQKALAAAGGDTEVLREITGLFLVDLPSRLYELREAVRTGTPEQVARIAHGLRGSAAVFGSDPAVAATFELEHLAKQGDREAIPAAAGEVERLFQKLAQAVADRFVPGNSPQSQIQRPVASDKCAGEAPEFP